MDNFEFYTPTKVFFGRGQEEKIGEIIASYGFKKVLLHYGSGSVKASGLLDKVIDSLKAHHIDYVALGGVRPNPVLSMVRKGIKLCQEEKVDFILSVGGGSVIDSGKAIADGLAHPDQDVWKFFIQEEKMTCGFPHGNILTLAASGSEMSNSCVITNEEGQFKRGLSSDFHRPLFTICNPELTFTVNKFQTGCGTVDIMMHTLERYFSGTKGTPLTDRMAEGLLQTVIEAGAVADQNPTDYEARATLMWAGSMSHNGLTGAGRFFVLQVHQLEHELSGMFPEVAHGAGLSALFCSWARYVYRFDVPRFMQYAVRVWHIDMDFEHPEKTALAGIDATEKFFKSLGMPISLHELGIELNDKVIDELAEKCTFFGKRTIKGTKEFGKEDIAAVFNMAR